MSPAMSTIQLKQCSTTDWYVHHRSNWLEGYA